MLIDDIECIDIDVSNICNLRCPLCPSVIGIDKHGVLNDKHFADFNKLMHRLKQFRGLKTVQVAGAASEPMLHPQIVFFVQQLISMDVSINIFTNGDVEDDNLWISLAHALNNKAQIVFTICGTTQAMHQKYRVGSSLVHILHNAHIIKQANSQVKTYMQYIRFQYNKYEDEASIKRLALEFSSYGILHTDTIYERYFLGQYTKNDGVCSDISFATLYSKQQRHTLAKKRRKIICNSLMNKVVQMDPYGNIFPCLAYRLFSTIPFENDGKLDYSQILDDKHKFCYECDEDNLKFLNNYCRDPFYMCDNK